MKADGTVATEIVSGIIADLSDRRGFDNEWDAIDKDIREEIRDAWRQIVLKILARRGTE